MKGQKFLKVTSIIMIISGILGIIFGIIALLGMSALSFISGGEVDMTILYASMILAIIACVIQLVAGIKGNSACKLPETAKKCIPWGIVVAVIAIVSMVLGVVAGGDFSVTTLIINLVIPGLYLFGAKQLSDANTPFAADAE